MDPIDAEMYATEMCKEQILDLPPDDEVSEKIYQIVSMAAFTLYSLSEAKLRGLLEFAGLKLSIPDIFNQAAGITTCFVRTEAIILTNLFPESLVDPEHEMVNTLADSDVWRDRMEEIKFEGLIWRSEFFD